MAAGVGLVETGWVASFDAAAGTGYVGREHGERLAFHCTELTDGSRTVAEGVRVGFQVRPGHCGKWEAVAVSPLRELPGTPGR